MKNRCSWCQHVHFLKTNSCFILCSSMVHVFFVFGNGFLWSVDRRQKTANQNDPSQGSKRLSLSAESRKPRPAKRGYRIGTRIQINAVVCQHTTCRPHRLLTVSSSPIDVAHPDRRRGPSAVSCADAAAASCESPEPDAQRLG